MKPTPRFLCALALVVFPASARCQAPSNPAAALADTVITVESSALADAREVWIALPDDYKTSGARYPVLYLLDAGWHFLPAVAAVRGLAETSYIANHHVPRLIVVGIVNRDRNRDDTPTHCVAQHGMSFPTSGGADAFLAFMRDELVPLVDEHFRTEPYRILAGWSLGGLFAMYALLEKPDVFGAYLAISPSLWWDDRVLVGRATELAGDGTVRERDLVVTIGTGEEGGLCYDAVHELVRRWNQTPLPGLAFSFVEIPGEDHNHGPFKAYVDGLRALFSDWFFPEDAFAAGLDSLEAHYAELSRRRGYTIDVPDHIYDALARSYLADGRAADAVAAARAHCQRRPTDPELYFQLGEMCRKTGDTAAARDAYRTALDIELARSAPDTVFVNWLEGLLAGLPGED